METPPALCMFPLIWRIAKLRSGHFEMAQNASTVMAAEVTDDIVKHCEY